MDKIIKNTGIFFVIALLVSSMFMPVYSDNDYSDTKKWDKICETYKSYEENKASCDAYAQYLKDKGKELDKEIADLKKNINDITGSIKEDEKIITETAIKIEDINDEIAGYKREIAVLENDIVRLDDQIAERQLTIDEKTETANNYMVSVQPNTRLNAFVEFIFGATDFADVSRRVEGMNMINKKNQENIRELNEQKLVLEEEKLETEFKKKSVDTLITRQEERLAYQEELRAISQERVRILRAQYQEVLNAQKAAEEEKKLAASYISNIGSIHVDTSVGGLLKPIQNGSYWISARPWYYLGGGKHLGADLAASVGTALVAPANGIVIATYGSCPTYGSLSSGCGMGYGNYIVMIVSANNTTYGVLYAHLQNGGVNVGVGQTISQGQVIGRVGSSGGSTGPHLHVELFYLGSASVSEAYNNWYNGARNIQFGLGGSQSPSEYSNRCEVKGMIAPCRINSASYWGF